VSTLNLMFSQREIIVLHRLLSQGFTVADMVTSLDEEIASDKQPEAADAKLDRLALLRVISIVRTAATPQATPRLDGRNAAR